MKSTKLTHLIKRHNYKKSYVIFSDEWTATLDGFNRSSLGLSGNTESTHLLRGQWGEGLILHLQL